MGSVGERRLTVRRTSVAPHVPQIPERTCQRLLEDACRCLLEQMQALRAIDWTNEPDPLRIVTAMTKTTQVLQGVVSVWETTQRHTEETVQAEAVTQAQYRDLTPEQLKMLHGWVGADRAT
jgi:hypothetical protein